MFDGDEPLDQELFDISDIEIEFQRTKGTCKVFVIMKSQTPINLMRFYLALKDYLFQMEQEIGIMDEDFNEH